MDTGTRAFNCCFGNLTGGHTDDRFDHPLSVPGVYAFAVRLAKRPWYHFALLVPYALTAHRVERFK